MKYVLYKTLLYWSINESKSKKKRVELDMDVYTEVTDKILVV